MESVTKYRMSTKNGFIDHTCLEHLVYNLYQYIFHYRTYHDINHIQCLSMGIPVNTFDVSYKVEHGLYLVNNDNSIKLSCLFPQFTAIDNEIKKILGSTLSERVPKVSGVPSRAAHLDRVGAMDTSEPIKTKLPVSEPVKEANRSRRPRHKFYSSSNSNSDLKPNVSVQEVVPDKLIEPKNIVSVSDHMPKIKIFDSDKQSYLCMKRDIENGKLNINNIHSCFALKYDIFKILDIRSAINFSSNSNIEEEYELFTDLYNSCVPDDDELAELASNNKVYVPYNYHYWTDDKKTEHAKTYDMTQQEFEEKYIDKPDAELNKIYDITNYSSLAK